MHHIKLKVPSFAPFVTGIIDNIKMTVHKYHNVWVSHRMNYEPRKLMDVKHSCGLIFDDNLDVEVGFKFTGNHAAHSVFSPVMSLNNWLHWFYKINDFNDFRLFSSWWDGEGLITFESVFGKGHVIRPVNRPSDFLMSLHTCSSFHYLSHLTIKTIVTDDITVTFKPCR